MGLVGADNRIGPERLAELYAPVAADVEASARIFREELASDQPFIAEMCRHVGQFHGKRLRPAVLLLAAQACGGVRPAHHVLAAVVEMVHIATLVHDDILDESDVRRRAATVNRLWGNERAVLLGDFLISHAFHLCSSLDSQLASRLIGHTTNTVCEGEMMQVANRENFALAEPQYIDIITRKTASLIGACCELGAHYAGARAADVRALREYGIAVGIAFQITDDLLDLLGDEAEAGKSLGRDVDKGKLTLPVIHYLRTAEPGRREQLLEVLRGEGRQRYRQIAAMLEESESIEYAFEAAAGYIRRALGAIEPLAGSAAKGCLVAMAEFVLGRRQ